MFKFFQKSGRVFEAFISRKLNAWGKRFGFFHFMDVRNVHSLAKEMNGAKIRSLVLHVNVRRYRRREYQGREMEVYWTKCSVLSIRSSVLGVSKSAWLLSLGYGS